MLRRGVQDGLQSTCLNCLHGVTRLSWHKSSSLNSSRWGLTWGKGTNKCVLALRRLPTAEEAEAAYHVHLYITGKDKQFSISLSPSLPLSGDNSVGLVFESWFATSRLFPCYFKGQKLTIVKLMNSKPPLLGNFSMKKTSFCSLKRPLHSLMVFIVRMI